MSRTNIIVAIMRKEITDRLRNRWILTVSALLVVSAFTISFFGAAPVGLAGFQRSGMTMVSLINLAMYLVPLLALALGSFTIIDERERGTLDLILTYPMGATDYLSGSFLGLTVALSISILLGFGISGGVLLAYGGVIELGRYLIFLGLTLLLGVIFLAISYTISALASDKGKAMAVALIVWIASVFLFDMLLIGALVFSQGKIPAGLFSGLLMLNPVDVYRLLLFSIIESARAPIGLSESSLPSFMNAPFLAGVFLAWVLLLLFAAQRIFRRRIAGNLWARPN